MTRQRQLAVFWAATIVGLVLVFLIFRPILLPFVAGAAIAYLLDPVVGRLEERGFGRGTATVALLLVMMLVLLAIAVLVAPLLIEQTISLVRGLPNFATRLQELFGSVLESDWARFLGLDPESIRASVTSFLSRGAELTTTVLSSLWTGGRFVVDLASLLVVTPFVAFYLLRDWGAIVAWVDGLLPRDEVGEVERLARAIDGKIAAFVRGQFIAGILLGIFYSVGLVALGLNYGLLIGMASGILSFVPYLGFSIGFVTSIVVALVQFWPDWPWLVAVIVVFVLGQFFEGYVLQPFLIGKSVGLHPVWLIFALFAFGYLFGFLGLLIAVPAAAAVGVIASYAIERYHRSAIFSGESQPPR
jgi:predicted PurR-regulated permease PerM